MHLMIVTNSAGNPSLAATALERDRITGHLQGKGWHVWHWFEDLWLVETPDDVDPDRLSNELNEAMGTPREMFIQHVLMPAVFQAQAAKSSIPWINRHWKPRTLLDEPGKLLG